jgi:hypothetical protein
LGEQDSNISFSFWRITGSFLSATESWNGTSWTEVNDLNTARELAGGSGTDNTSALAFGGMPGG